MKMETQLVPIPSHHLHLLRRVLQILLGTCLLFGTFGPGEPSLAMVQEVTCAGEPQSVSLPLTDLGDMVYTRMDGQKFAFTGGLYPDGSNTRPQDHEAAGLAIASQILPLDVDGNPDPGQGKVVMISVGMSNASMEFDRFVSLTNHNPEVNPKLFLLDGAQPSRTSERWVDPQAETWQFVNDRLAKVGLTPQQVQLAWVKQTQARGGDFPAKALALQSDLEAIARNLKTNYPNIKIAYFSSRTRSYSYWRGLSPEPVAFETGFAVKWMIEKQINNHHDLNYDPAKGEVKAPYLSWGPYLWIDGINPRSDGRVWTAEDLAEDCTHPSQEGSTKVAEMMMEFFKSDATTMNW